jgi:hypothetical protein
VEDELGMKTALGFSFAKARITCATVVPEPNPTTILSFTSFAAASAAARFHPSLSNLIPKQSEWSKFLNSVPNINKW